MPRRVRLLRPSVSGFSLLYAPAAGATRSYVCGWTGATLVRRLRPLFRGPESARCSGGTKAAGVNVLSLDEVSASTVGSAFASCCATWHCINAALGHLFASWAESTRTALAGAAAGSSLALAWPQVAGIATELHTASVLAGLRVLLTRVTRHFEPLEYQQRQGGTASSR